MLGLGCGLRPYEVGSAGASGTGGASTGDETFGASVTGAAAGSTTGMVEGTGSSGAVDATGDGAATCDVPDPTEGTWGCDVWSQDCPEGCKCMPYSGDRDGVWESLKCTPVMPNGGEAGDPCTVVESGVSGIDSCAKGFVCFWVNPETNEGWCVEQCTGSPFEPICTDPSAGCLIPADGVLNLCIGLCDPLAQACPEGQTCVPVMQDPNTFMCLSDASGEGQVFDPCEWVTECAPGLICVIPELADECAGVPTGCCVPYCDLDAPSCPGVGQECLPWYDEEMVPPGIENFGVCGIPQ